LIGSDALVIVDGRAITQVVDPGRPAPKDERKILWVCSLNSCAFREFAMHNGPWEEKASCYMRTLGRGTTTAPDRQDGIRGILPCVRFR
jgi:hypothetical protein